jgi:hypothetical protein
MISMHLRPAINDTGIPLTTLFVCLWVLFAPYHPLPKRKAHALRVSIAEPWASLLVEHFPANFHNEFSIELSPFGN